MFKSVIVYDEDPEDRKSRRRSSPSSKGASGIEENIQQQLKG